MGNQRFANRASSVLADPITNVAGTLTVSAGEGARFPTLAAGQFFYAVLQADDGDGDAREFVRVTARAADVLTIERGTEGTAAQAWPIGTTFAHIVTAAGMDGFATDEELSAVAADAASREPAVAAGTILQYWRGDKTWRSFATDVRSAVLTGISFATNAAVTAADSVEVAIGKLQAKANNLANDVLSTSLTGLSLASAAAITAGDTVLSAPGKLQKQITDLIASTTAATALRLLKAGDTMTGNLTLNYGNPVFVLAKTASGQANALYGQTGSTARWGLFLGATDAEAGSNSGSSFYLTRYSDTGVFLANALVISRSDGTAAFSNNVVAGGTIRAANGYLVPPSATGLQGTGVADEGGIYRFRVFAADIALSAVVQGYAEHQPSVVIRMRFVAGGNVFDMGSNGVGSSSGGWTATSDQRVKYDNQVIDNALDKVDQLTGYTYIRQDMAALDGSMPRKAGVIAQDVLKVLPEAVVVPANYNAEKMQGDLLALHTDALVGLLVNAVKELRTEAHTLRARVDALEARA